MTPRRVLVLGATGGTGRVLVEQAVAAGLAVTMLVRKPDTLPPGGGTGRAVTGDLLRDPAVLDAVVPGQDVVISTLGVGRYAVTFSGLGGLDGGVQVVAYGPSNNRCKVEGWSGVPDLRIDVRCHTPAGAPVFTPFLVHFFATNDTATPYREIGHARYDLPPDQIERYVAAFIADVSGA